MRRRVWISRSRSSTPRPKRGSWARGWSRCRCRCTPRCASACRCCGGCARSRRGARGVFRVVRGAARDTCARAVPTAVRALGGGEIVAWPALSRRVGGRRLARRASAALAYLPPSRGSLPPLARYAKLVDAGGVERLAARWSDPAASPLRHCPIPAVYGGRFFAVPSRRYRRRRAQNRRGRAAPDLHRPDFLNGRVTRRRGRALHERFPSDFDATCKVDTCAATPISCPISRVGGVFIVVGGGVAVERGAGHFDKGHPPETCFRRCRRARGGDVAAPDVLLRSPWTTARDYSIWCTSSRARPHVRGRRRHSPWPPRAAALLPRPPRARPAPRAPPRRQAAT